MWENRSLASATLILAALVSVACGPGRMDSRADAAALRERYDAYSAAYGADSIDAIMAYYADDAVRLPDDGSVATGRDAIEEIERGWRRDFEFSLDDYASPKIEVSGDLAVTRGTVAERFVSRATGLTGYLDGELLLVWRRQPDGTWRISQEMWTSVPFKPGHSCLDPTALKQLDARFEQALITPDATFFTELLADGFMWVHNHASALDDRASMMRSYADPDRAPSSASRTSSEVEVRNLGSTAIVTGFTRVERPDGTVKNYNFMRTYGVSAGDCRLLANHTMEIPPEQDGSRVPVSRERDAPPQRQAGAAAGIVRGHAIYGHEVRSFRPCGVEEALWVVGDSRLLEAIHDEFSAGREPYDEVFAVVEAEPGPAPIEGFGADYGGSLEIEAVLYAGLEGPACDADWEGFRYRARGNEPFWMVEVAGNELRLTRPGHDNLVWDIATEASFDTSLVITASTAPEGLAAQLTVSRQACRDSMSGAYFGFSASFQLGEEELTGCTLAGSQALA